MLDTESLIQQPYTESFVILVHWPKLFCMLDLIPSMAVWLPGEQSSILPSMSLCLLLRPTKAVKWFHYDHRHDGMDTLP